MLPFFVAGDERANEQTGLTVMHTLWLREHNRIARDLAAINPCWDDERLYQEARKIVAAQMQKISYDEFLPTIFGDYMDTYMSKYSGYNPFFDASIPNSFAAAAYRLGHSLIRNQLLRLDENFTATAIGHLPLARAFFNPVAYFEGRGTDYITRGLMVDISNPVDEFLNSVLTSKLFSKKPGELGGDLASLNIQRGRDHGLPSYRSWQRFWHSRGTTQRLATPAQSSCCASCTGSRGSGRGWTCGWGGWQRRGCRGLRWGPPMPASWGSPSPGCETETGSGSRASMSSPRYRGARCIRPRWPAWCARMGTASQGSRGTCSCRAVSVWRVRSCPTWTCGSGWTGPATSTTSHTHSHPPQTVEFAF